MEQTGLTNILFSEISSDSRLIPLGKASIRESFMIYGKIIVNSKSKEYDDKIWANDIARESIRKNERRFGGENIPLTENKSRPLPQNLFLRVVDAYLANKNLFLHLAKYKPGNSFFPGKMMGELYSART